MRVVAVSYLNTLPFIYGIQQAAPEWLRAALLLAPPADCADALINRQADIALVPVAEIPRIQGAQIITDYCLAAHGRVETVALLTNTPIDQLKTIYLDKQSRTSVQLVRILARELWKIQPIWIDGIPRTVDHGQAIVAIGDKVFDIESQFAFKYDLAEEWQTLTGGRPFVFAAWVARTEQGLQASQELNNALSYGTQHIAQAIAERKDRDKAYHYLTENLKFDLTDPAREAMKLFWEKIITPV